MRGLLTVSAVIAAGVHLFPFRTGKLSPLAPMVLGGQPPGRVGRRRLFPEEPPRAALRLSRRRGASRATRDRARAAGGRVHRRPDVSRTVPPVLPRRRG